MTQENLLDAMVEDLKSLFEHYTLHNSLGKERGVQVFPQDLPIREGEDETTNPENLPEPYILVKLPEGQQPQQDAKQLVTVVLVVCVCDYDKNRQGYRDALHIVNAIMHHYGIDGLVGKRYLVQHPIRWVIQEEDNHPYYFAAVGLTVEAPAIFKEVPET